jgi:hypothetical protein
MLWEEQGFTPIGLHESRHTAATWLDHAGVTPKVISEFVGRKTPEYQLSAARITPQVYTHMFPGELERARVLFDKFLVERAADDPVPALSLARASGTGCVDRQIPSWRQNGAKVPLGGFSHAKRPDQERSA